MILGKKNIENYNTSDEIKQIIEVMICLKVNLLLTSKKCRPGFLELSSSVRGATCVFISYTKQHLRVHHVEQPLICGGSGGAKETLYVDALFVFVIQT